MLASSQCLHFHTLESPLPWGALGLNAFNHPWIYQVNNMFSPPALVPAILSKFLAEHVTSQFILLILMAPCCMEAPWLPMVFRMLADVPYQHPIIQTLL